MVLLWQLHLQLRVRAFTLASLRHSNSVQPVVPVLFLKRVKLTVLDVRVTLSTVTLAKLLVLLHLKLRAVTMETNSVPPVPAVAHLTVVDVLVTL